MSLDITLYTTMPKSELSRLLETENRASPFPTRNNWSLVNSPERYVNEVLAEAGVEMDVIATAFFRVRNDAIDEDYGYLQQFLRKVAVSHDAVMLLNGETVMFSDSGQ